MRRTLLFALVAISVVVDLDSPVDAADRAAAEWFPATTVFYAESTNPPEILDAVLKHPLRQRLESLDSFQKAKDSADYQHLLDIVSVIETRIGMGWRDAIGALTAGGLYIGVDATTEGIMLLVKARDEPTLARIRDSLIKLAHDDAREKGRSDSITTSKYRGKRVDRRDHGKYVTLSHWLLVTDKDELVKQCVDCWLDSGGQTLADNPRFQTAKKSSDGRDAAWAFLDVAALRNTNGGRQLLQARTDSIVGELLVGGLLSSLVNTPYATGSIELSEQNARLVLSTPHRWAWIPEERRYYFGNDGSGVALSTASPPRTLLTVSVYRDVSRMWLHTGDLFGEDVNAELASANDRFSTMFSGRDFAKHILGAIGPEFQAFVTHQEYAHALPRPEIRLPAAAIQLRLKDREATEPELRKTFQSLIAFFNIMGSQRGQPRLVEGDETQDGQRIFSATFVPDASEEDSQHASIHFNFSPAMAFVGDRCILASSTQLARDLAGLAAQSDAPSDRTDANAWAKADLQTVRQAMNDSRGHLVAQSVLREGLSERQASERLNAFLSLLEMFRDVSVRLDATDEKLELSAEVGLAEPHHDP